MAVALVANLGACSRSTPDQGKPEVSASASGKVAEPEAAAPSAAKGANQYEPLMQAVFGAAYRPAKGDAVAEQPDPDQPRNKMKMLLTPVNSTTLPTGETVLVVNGEAADDAGNGQAGHPTPGLLSLYLLSDKSGAWQVVARHESVAALGSFGKIGPTRWVKSTSGRPLLAVMDGGTWTGYTVSYLSLFDPAASQVRNLTPQIPISSDSEGACGPSTSHCYAVDAQWHFAPSTSGDKYDDLVLVFSGWDEVAAEAPAKAAGEEQAQEGEAQPAHAEEDDEKPVQRVRKKISGAARYVFDKTAYRLKSGENPVPIP